MRQVSYDLVLKSAPVSNCDTIIDSSCESLMRSPALLRRRDTCRPVGESINLHRCTLTHDVSICFTPFWFRSDVGHTCSYVRHMTVNQHSLSHSMFQAPWALSCEAGECCLVSWGGDGAVMKTPCSPARLVQNSHCHDLTWLSLSFVPTWCTFSSTHTLKRFFQLRNSHSSPPPPPASLSGGLKCYFKKHTREHYLASRAIYSPLTYISLFFSAFM